MKRHRSRKIMCGALLASGGLVFGSGPNCLPDSFFASLGESARAAALGTVTLGINTAIQNVVGDALFPNTLGADATDGSSAGVQDLSGTDMSGSGSGNPDDEPPPFP